jgi:hypothetical protein
VVSTCSIAQGSLCREGAKSDSYRSPPCEGSLFGSPLYHVPARVYCRRSSVSELAEDPTPRLVLFLVYKQMLLV